jgi:predicted nucleic acid-binding protein
LPKTNKFVLDSYALIGYLENELFADRIETLLKQAGKKHIRLYLHAIHLGEVYYITFREQGRAVAETVYSKIKRFPLTIIDQISEPLLLTAAEFKATYPISYADSFAAAMSKKMKATLLSRDPEFKPLELQGIIQVEWLI